MPVTTGTFDPIKVVPVAPGEAHLQNVVTSYKCYICGCEEHEDMALLRINGKNMAMVCTDHTGVIQEFIRQYRNIPLGWKKLQPGDFYGRPSNDKKS